MQTAPVVLASRSAARIALLAGAGIAFAAVPSAVDERAVEAPLIAGGASPADVAVALAEAKAVEVSARMPAAMVIGADQTLDLDGERWTKPATIAIAREQLARLSGRTHRLHSGVALARGGIVTWRHVASAALTMRTLTAAATDAYMAEVARCGPLQRGGVSDRGRRAAAVRQDRRRLFHDPRIAAAAAAGTAEG